MQQGVLLLDKTPLSEFLCDERAAKRARHQAGAAPYRLALILKELHNQILKDIDARNPRYDSGHGAIQGFFCWQFILPIKFLL